MYTQTIPAPTHRYASLLQREQGRLERSLQQVFPRIDTSFAPVAGLLAARIATSQQRIATAGMNYTEELLGEFIEDAGTVTTRPLVGVTGAGIDVEEVFAGARIMSTQDSLRAGLVWALQLAHTALADTGRQSVVLGMGTRNCGGYMRALVGNTCSRCAILAGRLYWTEEPFKRHPQCDCQHIPYKSEPDEKYLVDAEDYFNSLSEAQQDNINQVVNARRGMWSVADMNGRRRMARREVFGQQLYVTSEGMTRRGIAYSRLRDRRAGDVKLPGSRYVQSRAPRMMPESIMEVAGTNKTLYLNLLKRHGYIL
jgi:hypothetical protein